MNVENGNESKSNQRGVRCDTLEWSREHFVCPCVGIIYALAARIQLLALVIHLESRTGSGRLEHFTCTIGNVHWRRLVPDNRFGKLA